MPSQVESAKSGNEWVIDLGLINWNDFGQAVVELSLAV